MFLFERSMNDPLLESKFNQVFIETNQRAVGLRKMLKNVT